MRNIRKVFSLMKGQHRTFIGFVVLYKTLLSALLVPFCLWLIQKSLDLAGLKYVTQANISGLFNPLVLLASVLSLLILSIYTLTELSCVLLLFECGRRGQPLGLRQLFREGFQRTLRVLKPCNWGIVLFAMLLVPFGGFFLQSTLAGNLRLPESISTAISSSTILTALLYLVIIGIAFLALRCLFVFHAFFLDGKDMRAAIRESGRLLKKRYFRTVLGLLGWLSVVTIVSALVLGLFVLIAGALMSFTLQNEAMFTVLAELIAYGVPIVALILSVITMMCTYAWASQKYYSFKAEDGSIEALNVQVIPKGKTHRHGNIWVALLIVVCLLTSSMSSILVERGNAVFDEDDLRAPKIVAHRGSALHAPENTLPAIRNAIADGADYAEIDVRLTVDNVAVLAHDANLKRTTGIDINVGDISLYDLMQYDRGATFSAAFAGTRFATLEEAIETAKGHIKLMIEIKADDPSSGVEKIVADIVRDCDFTGECIIASLNYKTIERVKEYAPELQTQYLMSVGVGNVSKLPAADAIGIQMPFLTKKMVTQAHEAGKPLFVWTVNGEKNIQTCVDYGADYIITDDPLNTRTLVKLYGTPLAAALMELRQTVLGEKGAA